MVSRKHRLLICVSAILMAANLLAETVMYKRTGVVQNGVKSSKNDDAHYITFIDKGCYESDAKGMSAGKGFIEYLKTENGIRCYHGEGYLGDAFYYFSSDMSKLNVNVDGVVHVYTKVTSNQAGAPMRTYSTGSSTGAVVGGGYVPVPVAPGNVTNAPTNSKSRRTCTMCNGTGKGMSTVSYAADYTGYDYVYCTECNRYMSRHTHLHPNYSSCHGKGYLEY